MDNISAILGDPPRNQDDFFIVRGIFRSAGVFNANASKGWVTVPSKPAGYEHETKQPGIIAGMSIVLVLIVVVTASRLALRYFSKSMKFGSDDWVILIAASIAITYPILQIVMVVQGGAGHHVWEVTYQQYNIYAYYGRLCQMLFYVGVGLIKISITLFIRRIVHLASHFWTTVANVFLVIEVAYVLVAIFWQVFLCRPSRASWDRWYSGSLAEPASCWATLPSVRTLRITHLVLGVLLLMVPVAILWSVQMSWQKKARLFLIWAAGALSVIGGLLQELKTISSDSTWSYTDILVWTCVDLCMGIITASLPVMDGWLFGSFDGTGRGKELRAFWRRAALSKTESEADFARELEQLEMMVSPHKTISSPDK